MAKRSAVPSTDIKPIGKAIDDVIVQLQRGERRPPIHIKLHILSLKAAKIGIKAHCGKWRIFHTVFDKGRGPIEK